MPFRLESEYQPEGDQAQAIAKLTKSLTAGNHHQTLLDYLHPNPVLAGLLRRKRGEGPEAFRWRDLLGYLQMKLCQK